MYQYCRICALPTKSKVKCKFWNKWKGHHDHCKEFVLSKTKIEIYDKKFIEKLQEVENYIQTGMIESIVSSYINK